MSVRWKKHPGGWKDYKFGTDLDLADFTRTALKRML